MIGGEPHWLDCGLMAIKLLNNECLTDVERNWFQRYRDAVAAKMKEIWMRERRWER